MCFTINNCKRVDLVAVWVYVLLLSSFQNEAVLAKDLNFLMIGNSYTNGNGLRAMVSSMLREKDTVRVGQQFIRGGETLKGHVRHAQSPSVALHRYLISDPEPWDFVIMQEQSQIPAFRDLFNEYNLSSDAASRLSGYVRGTGARPIFFQTWGRREGDTVFFSPGTTNYKTHQAQIVFGYEGYEMVSNQNNLLPTALVAPTGQAFEYVYDSIVNEGNNPLTRGSLFYDLYKVDGSHPSVSGSYLAACVLYGTVTKRDPVALSFVPNGVNATTARSLRNAASQTLIAEGILPAPVVPSSPPPSRLPTFRPSRSPTSRPTRRPTIRPTRNPTRQPTRRPTSRPTRRPSIRPTRNPTRQPTRRPTSRPTRRPTIRPTRNPTRQPTRRLTSWPTRRPTIRPTRNPTRQPTRRPTSRPTRRPTRSPINQPTRLPISRPSPAPIVSSSQAPTDVPIRPLLPLPLGVPSENSSDSPSQLPIGRANANLSGANTSRAPPCFICQFFVTALLFSWVTVLVV